MVVLWCTILYCLFLVPSYLNQLFHDILVGGWAASVQLDQLPSGREKNEQNDVKAPLIF